MGLAMAPALVEASVSTRGAGLGPVKVLASALALVGASEPGSGLVMALVSAPTSVEA